MMAEVIYLLCAMMSTVCAIALYRGYRKTLNKLLLWSGICFALLALNNIFLCIDLIILPDLDLNGPFWRGIITACAAGALLSGLILEVS